MLPTSPQSSSFQTGLFILMGILMAVPSILFIPGTPLLFTKTFTIALVVLIGLLLFIAGQLKSRSVTLSTHPTLLALWLLPAAYLLSTIFSSNMRESLFGQSLNIDTFAFILLATVAATLVGSLVSVKKRVLYFYGALLVPGVFLALFHLLRLFFGPDTFSFGLFTTPSSTPIGNWNDLAVLFGLLVVFSLITLFTKIARGVMAVVVSAVLAVSLFFLAVINFSVVWWIVAFVSLAVFVYSVIAGRSSDTTIEVPDTMGAVSSVDTKPQSQKTGDISFTSLVVLAVALAFVLFGNSVSGYLSDTFNLSPLSVRPSWESTIDVGKRTYEQSPVFGSGPNTFDKQWLLFKPNEVNQTVFWNVRFNTGIGFIPTSFVTNGLIGIIAWSVFFFFFLYAGIRSFFRRQTGDAFSLYLAVSSFVFAAYLWVVAFLYTPSASILLFAFLFTGISIGMFQHLDGARSSVTVSFTENPRLGFVTVLVLTVVFLGSIGALFTIGEKYVAAYTTTQAVSLAAEGDVAAAQEAVNRALVLDENDTYHRFASDLTRRRLEQLVAQTSQITEESQSQFQSLVGITVQHAQSAVQLDDTNDLNWATLARAYQALTAVQVEGSYENASRAYAEALTYNPKSPVLQLEQAQLELAVGEINAAKQHLQKALEQKANYTDARFLLAQIQLAEGDVDDAIRSVESIALTNPNNPVIFFQLGVLYYGATDYQIAIQALERAVALDTDYSNARYFLGLSYYRTGRASEAVEQFEIIRRLNPGNDDVIGILDNLKANRSPLPGVTPITELDGPPLEEEE